MKIKLLDELLGAKTVAELDASYARQLTEWHFPNFTYTRYASQTEVDHETFSPFMKGWHTHFHQANYEVVDPVGDRVRTSIIPVEWHLKTMWQEASGQSKQLFGEALDYGLSEGVSFPLYGRRGFEAIQVIHHPSIVMQLETHPEFISALQQLGMYYHHCLSQLKSPAPPVTLTERELECLRFTEKQLSAKEIAKILCISPRTVVFHLENCNRKLNTINKFYAVLKAKELGVL